jgi:tetratricopeptide (TPR) repeat protein
MHAPPSRGGAHPSTPKEDAAPATNTAGGPKVSAAARPALIALQNAVNSGDANAIRTAAAAAQAVAVSKEEKYLVGQLQLKGSLAANDDAQASSAIDIIAASGYLTTPQVSELYLSLGDKLLKQKQYAVAATVLNKAAALNPNDMKTQIVVGDALLAGGQPGQAIAIYQKALAAQKAAGRPVDEALYRRAVQAAFNSKSPAAADLSKQWVLAYPNKDSWRNSVAIYMSQSKPDDEGALDLWRLMRATNALTKPDLESYVGMLVDSSNFIEAQTALNQAQSFGIDAASIQSLKGEVAGKPTVTAAELAAAAKSAQSATALLRIADRYYGLGEYAKAADTYRAAKAKGAEADLADLRTGIALAGAGDTTGATAALNSVKGSRAGIAQYWLMYLQKKG